MTTRWKKSLWLATATTSRWLAVKAARLAEWARAKADALPLLLVYAVMIGALSVASKAVALP